MDGQIETGTIEFRPEAGAVRWSDACGPQVDGRYREGRERYMARGPGYVGGHAVSGITFPRRPSLC